MGKISVIVRDDLQAWVERHADADGYPSIDAFMNNLLEEARARLDRLQRQIDAGRASGVDPRPMEEIFADLRAKMKR